MVAIIRLKGGLGNQLFQYAIGCSIVRKFGAEVAYDQYFFSRQNLRENELEDLGLVLDYASANESARLGAPNFTINKIIHKLKLESMLYKYYFSEKESFKKQDFSTSFLEKCYIDGYWQNLDYFKDSISEICKSIKILEPKRNSYSEYLAIARKTNSVAVHVRRGDYISQTHTKSIHNVCGIKYYDNAIKMMNAMQENPHYILVSDDIDWCKKEFSSLESKTFVCKTNKSAEDFSIIASCKSHIIPNSTFSWWSTLCAQQHQEAQENGAVIFPKYWQRGLQTQTLNLNFMPAARSFFIE